MLSDIFTKRKLIRPCTTWPKSTLLERFRADRIRPAPDDQKRAIPRLDQPEISQFATTKVDPELWKWFAERIYYVQGSADDAASYQRLKEELAKIDAAHGTHGNYFFYLAVSPSFFSPIVKKLGEAGLANEDKGWRRVIIEKPFGRTTNRAPAHAKIREVLAERQHLPHRSLPAGETVQNILVFRFSNGIEPIWNRRYIDHVQITVSETVGVEQRGGYYETSGTLRDMVPNHIFQPSL